MKWLNMFLLGVKAVFGRREPTTATAEVPLEVHTLLAVLDQLRLTPKDQELASRLELLGFRIMSTYTAREDRTTEVLARRLVRGAIPAYVAALQELQTHPMRIVEDRQRFLRLHDACADVARQLGGSASKAVASPT